MLSWKKMYQSLKFAAILSSTKLNAKTIFGQQGGGFIGLLAAYGTVQLPL
jgi:hypothetical protein